MPAKKPMKKPVKKVTLKPKDIVEYVYDDGNKLREGVGEVVDPKNAFTPKGYVVLSVPVGKHGESWDNITVSLDNVTKL
jgi:putative intracellular protease/amidase